MYKKEKYIKPTKPYEKYTPDYEKQMYLPKDIERPDVEDDYELDREYMKSLYPELSKRIQNLVDEECDKLEYDDSIMYDEYPSKEDIDMIVAKIYIIIENEWDDIPNLAQDVEGMDNEVNSQQYQYYVPGRNIWLRDNIQVQLLNEMFGRRRRRYPRRYYRSYYPRYYQRYQPYQYVYYLPYQPYVPFEYRYYYY